MAIFFFEHGTFSALIDLPISYIDGDFPVRKLFVISVDSRDFLENLEDRDGFFKAEISPRCIRSWLFCPFFFPDQNLKKHV